MADFDDLIIGLQENEGSVKEYFEKFFSKANFKNYEIEEGASPIEIKAIRTLFESKKNLKERVEQVFSINPLCLEAFYVYYIISDDIFLKFRCETYLEHADDFPDFSSYQKSCYARILDFYADFLLEIHNMTQSLRVQKLLVKLCGYNEVYKLRLSFIYSTLEIADDFYRMYLETEFEAYDYLLLIAVLLKHDDAYKAREVLMDMFENVEYSDYLDHMWDLDLDDEEQKEFYEAVEDCYDDLQAVPEFFSFVNMVKEEEGKA